MKKHFQSGCYPCIMNRTMYNVYTNECILCHVSLSCTMYIPTSIYRTLGKKHIGEIVENVPSFNAADGFDIVFNVRR